MASTVNINDMADVIMQGLTEFAELATDDMKEAVKNASTTVRKEIKANAPEDTGKYAKSWTAKKVRETSQTLTMVVHSKNRYQLAHLLEYGHVIRSGGRITGQAKAHTHIAAVAEKLVNEFEREVERKL